MRPPCLRPVPPLTCTNHPSLFLPQFHEAQRQQITQTGLFCMGRCGKGRDQVLNLSIQIHVDDRFVDCNLKT